MAQLTDLNVQMLQGLLERNLLAPATTQEACETLVHDLLFPLYPFDLSENKNFDRLPSPEWPENH